MKSKFFFPFLLALVSFLGIVSYFFIWPSYFQYRGKEYRFDARKFALLSKKMGYTDKKFKFMLSSDATENKYSIIQSNGNGEMFAGSRIDRDQESLTLVLYLKKEYLEYKFTDEEKRSVERVVNGNILQSLSRSSKDAEKSIELSKSIEANEYPFHIL